MTNVIYGIIAGVKVPFQVPQGDACANGIQCPVIAGTTYTEQITIEVLPVYPTVKLIFILNTLIVF